VQPARVVAAPAAGRSQTPDTYDSDGGFSHSSIDLEADNDFAPLPKSANMTPDDVIRLHKDQIQDMMELMREVCVQHWLPNVSMALSHVMDPPYNNRK
jgi:hypothetical protein